jgi:hypothetical protein
MGSVAIPAKVARKPYAFDPFASLGANLLGAWVSGQGYGALISGKAGFWQARDGKLAWVSADSGLRPTPGATTGPNNQSGLTFVSGSSTIVSATGPALPQPLHKFVVAKFTASGSTGTLIDGNTTALGRGRIYRTGTAQMSISAGTVLNSSATPDLTLPHLHEALFSGASSYYKCDGVQLAAGNAGTTTSTSGVNIGAGIGTGDASSSTISEIWIFGAEVTGQTLSDFKQLYLAQKFALSLT